MKKIAIVLILAIMSCSSATEDGTPQGQLKVNVTEGGSAGSSLLWVFATEGQNLTITDAFDLLANNTANITGGGLKMPVAQQQRFTGVFQLPLPAGEYFVVAMLAQGTNKGEYRTQVVSVTTGTVKSVVVGF